MGEVILKVDTLPEPISRHIAADKVRVREEGGMVILMPVTEEAAGKEYKLYGMFKNSKLSADEFMARKHEEKEFEF